VNYNSNLKKKIDFKNLELVIRSDVIIFTDKKGHRNQQYLVFVSFLSIVYLII